MKIVVKKLVLAVIIHTACSYSVAQEAKVVGGAPMYINKTILENISKSVHHSIFVSSLKMVGLEDLLNSKECYTVFAPTNDAFMHLPYNEYVNFIKRDNKDFAKNILSYHILQGDYSMYKIIMLIEKGNGKAAVKTIQGETLNFIKKGGNIQLQDAQGNRVIITIPDIKQSNGVIHIINSVLKP